MLMLYPGKTSNIQQLVLSDGMRSVFRYALAMQADKPFTAARAQRLCTYVPSGFAPAMLSTAACAQRWFLGARTHGLETGKGGHTHHFNLGFPTRPSKAYVSQNGLCKAEALPGLHKMGQDGPKMGQDSPKIRPLCPKMGFVRPRLFTPWVQEFRCSRIAALPQKLKARSGLCGGGRAPPPPNNFGPPGSFSLVSFLPGG